MSPGAYLPVNVNRTDKDGEKHLLFLSSCKSLLLCVRGSVYSYITFCIDPFLRMSARLKISCALRIKVDRDGQIFGSGSKCRLLLDQCLIWPP